MQTTTSGCTVPVEEELLDLVLSDPDLLQAEFEAIIAASFPAPPNSPPPTTPPVVEPTPSGPRAYRTQSLPLAGSGGARPRCPRPAAVGRQRSPL